MKKNFVVELIGGHPIRFIDPTAVRKAFGIVALEKATQFPSEAAAKIRAHQEIPASQFNVVELDAEGKRVERPVEEPSGARGATRPTKARDLVLSEEQRGWLWELCENNSYAKASRLAAEKYQIQISAASLCRLYQAGELEALK